MSNKPTEPIDIAALAATCEQLADKGVDVAKVLAEMERIAGNVTVLRIDISDPPMLVRMSLGDAHVEADTTDECARKLGLGIANRLKRSPEEAAAIVAAITRPGPSKVVDTQDPAVTQKHEARLNQTR